MPLITIIVPAYNEAGRWPVEYWNELLTINNIRWIFVNDGSSDKTESILCNLPNPERYHVINLDRNQGKAEALRNGFLHFFSFYMQNEQQIVGYLDADAAFAKSDILRICNLSQEKFARLILNDPLGSLPKTHAVWGSRVALSGRQIDRKMLRHYFGRLVANFLSLQIDRIPYDSQCGLKLFVSTNQLKHALAVPFDTRWFVDLEILLRLRLNEEFVPWEEPLEYWHDVPGSHLGLRDILRILTEIRTVLKANARLNSSSN